MQKGSTLFLKGVVTFIGLVVLAICLFILPPAIKSEISGTFDYGYIFLGLYLSAIPFFSALYQAICLLGLIDQNRAFSKSSVQALSHIKYCALTISILFTIAIPHVLSVTQRTKAPEIIAIDLIVVFAAIVITTFAAVLQKLLQNALEIKSENDLMI